MAAAVASPGEKLSKISSASHLASCSEEVFAVALTVPLASILVWHGAGSEVMCRITAPMIGGLLTAPCSSCS